jgi:2-hydroxy-3-oxopropionate reductase
VSDIGFIGLGTMGAPMAGHLLAAGLRVHAFARHRSHAQLSELGYVPCESSRQVAQKSDVIITMLPDTADVESVLFGAAGVAEGLGAGKLVIDMSSISPLATREFARRVAGYGADYLDAPVSGGEVGAKAATLTIMVGGQPQAFERARTLFERMGRNVTLVGDVGAGQVAKIANQIIVALTIEAVGEALLFASKAGADTTRVRAALMGGFAASRVLEVHGERMIRRNFEPGFRMELHRKDLGLALEGGRQLGLALPHTSSCLQLMTVAVAQGLERADHSSLVQVLELMAKHTI